MVQETLVLVKPTEEYARDAIKYKDACLESDGEVYGGAGLGAFEDYTKWLQSLEQERKKVKETYFAMHDQDDKIIGMVEINHSRNGELRKEEGNIELSVRPCYRGEGNGKRLLELALNRCRELGLRRVLLSCGEEKFRSANLILSCGGQEEINQGGSETVRRFWITL